jgi:hypothetical protein
LGSPQVWPEDFITKNRWCGWGTALPFGVGAPSGVTTVVF